MHSGALADLTRKGILSVLGAACVYLASLVVVVVGWGGEQSRKEDKRGPARRPWPREEGGAPTEKEEPGQDWLPGRATSAVTSGAQTGTPISQFLWSPSSNSD